MTEKWTKVMSTMISHVAHDNETGVLKVRFANGREYHYHDVPDPEQLVRKITHAPSAGKAFGEHVRGRYKHTEITTR